MGKLSHVVKPRTCLVCRATLELTSKQMKRHARLCKGRKSGHNALEKR